MCLDKIMGDKQKKKWLATNEGYKTFRVRDGELYSADRDRSKKRSIQRWLKASKGKIGVGEVCYESGFHIFLTMAGAKIWLVPGEVIRKVRFKDVTAYGSQLIGSAVPIVVAKQIYIEA